MLNAITFCQKRGFIKQLVLSGSLVVLLGLLFPAATLADPPDPEGADTCAKCHEEETDAWQDSPHAEAAGTDNTVPGATCEACHGSYAENHPKDGLMGLSIDSSICQDCHSSTFTQWEDTKHAEAGVQCIGCHLSHSQESRLSDEKLCVSCHRDQIEEVFHVTHTTENILCVDCHLSSTTHEAVSTSDNVISAPSHDFANVESESCVECHSQSSNAVSRPVTNVGWESNKESLVERDCVPELATKLETAQQKNRSLETMVPVSLGLGMGIGGMLGVILMLVIGYINQRKATR